MEQKSFLDFCKDNLVKIPDYQLDYFEKEKLIYPIKRKIVPEEYAILQQQGEGDQSVIKRINVEHLPLIKLEDEYFKFRNNIGDTITHPFDKVNEEWQKYLINPNEIDEWENYEVNYIDADGKSWKTSKAENFYSYWQIYDIDSINEFRKRFLQIKLDTETNKYYLTSGSENVERYKSKRENIVKMSAFECHRRFLCDFIESYYRIKRIVYRQSAEYLTEDEVNTFNEKITEMSRHILDKNDISIDELYKFLNKLCNLYFEYGSKEKNRLQKLVKSDIWHTVELISYVNGESWQDIALKIDNITRFGIYIYTKEPKNVLEAIFPYESKEIKEKAMYHLDIRLKKYNENVLTDYELNNNDLDNFILFLENNGLSHFLIFVVDANEEYFKYTYKSRRNIIFLLRNLGIFVEEITKMISLSSNNSGIENQSSLKNILKTICGEEVWWGKYYDSKLGGINDKNVESRINEQLNKLNSSGQDDFILINLSISTILRNYYAHNSGQKVYFVKEYKRLLSCLINSIFIIWALGRKKI
ncbi:hypothetical protein [Methanosarcina acetivorans]|nr:hypothetical protein [Methanosarcina acetivorans]